MLNRITKKQYNMLQVVDLAGLTYKVKILNAMASGMRIFLYDMTLVADVDTDLRNNHVFQLPTGEWAIVTYKTPHFHRESVIRYSFDVVIANDAVTITRPTAQTTGQGGPKGFADVPVCTDMPCKVGLGKVNQNTTIDEDLELFVLLMSSATKVKKGDKITLKSGFYATAKVEGLFKISEGLQEIRFDIDPRG